MLKHKKSWLLMRVLCLVVLLTSIIGLAWLFLPTQPVTHPTYDRHLNVELGQSTNWESDTAAGLKALKQGHYGEAEKLFLAALENEDGSRLAISLDNLAVLYQAQGKYAKAEPLFKRSVRILEKDLGPEPLILATPLQNLAILYNALGKYIEAEPLFKRSLAIWEGWLGPGHPQVATNLENYSELLRKTNRETEAAKLEARAKGIREYVLVQRFVDRGLTVFEYQTGLEWEKKTDDGGIHDVNRTYTWSATLPNPDGTAFDFIDQLNTSPCFAGHCDWRLPEVNRYGGTAELETILLPEAPGSCPRVPDPCIDPIFGPTAASSYWSATTTARCRPICAWLVHFAEGLVGWSKTLNDAHVRAVRTGP